MNRLIQQHVIFHNWLLFLNIQSVSLAYMRYSYGLFIFMMVCYIIE